MMSTRGRGLWKIGQTWTRGGRGSKILEILRTSYVHGPFQRCLVNHRASLTAARFLTVIRARENRQSLSLPSLLPLRMEIQIRNFTPSFTLCRETDTKAFFVGKKGGEFAKRRSLCLLKYVSKSCLQS